VYVLIVEYLVPIARIDELRPAHVEYLQRHYDDGTFLVSGGRTRRSAVSSSPRTSTGRGSTRSSRPTRS
jgi:uncharacterized protein YciI